MALAGFSLLSGCAAPGTPAGFAAKEATSTIPIVVGAIVDPVETGLVASLAHPGGNITGMTNMTSQLVGKQLALLKEIAPGLTGAAVFWNPLNPALLVPPIPMCAGGGRPQPCPR